MTTLSISLPEPMRQFVEQSVKDGSYSTTSEYIRALIRAEQEKREKLESLRRDIQIGVDEIERGEVSNLSFAEIRAKAAQRLAATKGT